MDDVRTQPVKIGGRTFELAYSVGAMIDFKKIVPDLDTEKMATAISTPEGMIDVLYILAKYGALLKGETLDVSKEWFMVHIPANAKKCIGIQVAIMNAMTNAMAMETEEDEEDDREVDVALQEIQKKSAITD